MILVIFIAVLSALAAQAGGLIALKNRDKLNLSLGLTAGVLLGLVAFDLLPEIYSGVKSTNLDIIWPMTALIVGFLGFHVIEKAILIHHNHESNYSEHHHPHVGLASAFALIGHSFLDGLSIGLAFQINSTVGLVVSIAVIGHRFVDGFNGVNIMLINKNKTNQIRRVLWLLAVAPILGALIGWVISLPESALIIYLGFLSGFMLYIGASDILPEAHRKNSSKTTILATFLGVAIMLVVTKLVDH